MSTYHLSVITPHGRPFEGQIESLIAPGAEGAFGILANHAPFIATLSAGVLTVVHNGTKNFFALTAGVLEVNAKGSVLVLADYAAGAKTLEDAQDKIESAVKNKI